MAEFPSDLHGSDAGISTADGIAGFSRLTSLQESESKSRVEREGNCAVKNEAPAKSREKSMDKAHHGVRPDR